MKNSREKLEPTTRNLLLLSNSLFRHAYHLSWELVLLGQEGEIVQPFFHWAIRFYVRENKETNNGSSVALSLGSNRIFWMAANFTDAWALWSFWFSRSRMSCRWLKCTPKFVTHSTYTYYASFLATNTMQFQATYNSPQDGADLNKKLTGKDSQRQGKKGSESRSVPTSEDQWVGVITV